MSKRPSCILDPGMCLTLRPMKYPDFYDKYRDSIKNTWTVEEVDFTTDIMDLRTVEEPIRHLIERLVAFFATGDSIVSNNLVLNLYKHINAPEARMFLSRQLYEEALHVQFYLTLLDTYIPDQNRRSEAFSAVENVPSVKKKAEFCFKWIDSVSSIDRLETPEQKKAFLLNLICFASCIEGLFFFAAFAYVYFLRSRGILNGLAAGTNWVFRDESCVHPSTDVLTPRGWVPFPELTDEDEVAQWDPDTEVISFVKPLRVIRKRYSGDLHHFFHKKGGIDQLITSDHDMIWKWDYQNKYKKEKASEFKLNGKKHIPVSGTTAVVGPDSLTPMERFLVALQADGTLPSGRYSGSLCGTLPVSFNLKKPRKIERLKKILDDAGWKYTTLERSRTTFHVSVPLDVKLTKNFSDWVDIKSRSAGWLNDFIEETTHWDGHFPQSAKYRQYVSTVETNSDFVQASAVLCDHHSFKSPRVDNRKESYKDVFNVYTSKKSYVHCGTLNHEVSNYDGMVYCVTVPTGAFVTRRDGKVSITGNCHMNFAFSVIEVVRRESPELFDDDLNERISEMVREAVDCELQFAVDTLGVEKSGRSEILGLSYQDMSDYLGYVADTRLRTLGVSPVYNTKNPFSFMNFQDVQELANFFERRVSAYQTGVEGEVDLNGDF